MKKILIALIILLIPVTVKAGAIDYTTVESFPLLMIGGGNYNAIYELTSIANIDIPVFVSVNLTRFIPFAWNEFTISASIDNLDLNCQQLSLGYWECLVWFEGLSPGLGQKFGSAASELIPPGEICRLGVKMGCLQMPLPEQGQA